MEESQECNEAPARLINGHAGFQSTGKQVCPAGQVVVEVLLWFATACSIGGTMAIACLGEHQFARLLGFVVFIPGNLVWIWFSRRIGSRQLMLLNLVFLFMSLVGVSSNI